MNHYVNNFWLVFRSSKYNRNLVKNLANNYEEIEIDTPYITLGQLLKLANVFESGGMIKNYLNEQGVIVNDQLEHRRGRKLYPNDLIVVENIASFIVKEKE